jgi:hypothetical protein
MRKAALFSLPLLLLSSLLISGQEESKETLARRTNEPLKVDGLLNEPAWKKAAEAKELIQSPLNTSVKILYDDNFIYFGFQCDDPQPDSIEARVKGRDEDLREDDSVHILIDTFQDREIFYYFGTNSSGAQVDGRVIITEEGIDLTWDAVWKSEAQRTDSGWSAEIAIDLASLNYKPGTERAFGLSLARIVPRMLERSFWTGPLDPAFNISQLGRLPRVSLFRKEKKISVSPRLMSISEAGNSSLLEWGLDLSCAFGQRASGRLTLNPDFAFVEPDEEQINLTRFELYLPEKRSFFLEGSQAYDQKIRLFYSKRIPDIYGGMKFNGKSERFEFSGMSSLWETETDRGQYLANVSVLRFKQNFIKSSSISFLAANRLVNGKNIGTAGVDTSFRLFDFLQVTGQLAASYGNYNSDNTAFFICPNFDSKTLHLHLAYSHLGKNFADNVNKVGFIPDDNRKELDCALDYALLVKNGSLEQVRYGSRYNVYRGMDGNLRSWEVEQGLTFDLKNKFSLSAHHIQEFKAEDNVLFEEDFRNHQTKLGIGFNTKEWEYAVFSFSFGHNFGEPFTMVEIGKNLNVTPDLAVEFHLARIYFGYGRNERNDYLHVIRATYQFTPKLSLKIFHQTHRRIHKTNTEFLFTYQILPPSGFIQLAYQMGRGKFGERATGGNTLLLSANYMF